MFYNAKRVIKLQFYSNVYTWTQVKNCKISLAALDADRNDVCVAWRGLR